MSRPARPDPWPRRPAEARALQAALAGRVEPADRLGPVRRVAGLDAAFAEAGRVIVGAAVLLRAGDLSELARARCRRPTPFPYVPGLLSFREAPVLLEALAALAPPPDLLLVDGQGLAHPRRFGIACHIGVLADRPTIGVAKSRLVGAYAEPGPERGAWSPLVHEGEVVGAVLRTRAGVRPVFVSIGHRVSLESAIAWTLRLSPRFRLPEPIRRADRLSKAG